MALGITTPTANTYSKFNTQNYGTQSANQAGSLPSFPPAGSRWAADGTRNTDTSIFDANNKADQQQTDPNQADAAQQQQAQTAQNNSQPTAEELEKAKTFQKRLEDALNKKNYAAISGIQQEAKAAGVSDEAMKQVAPQLKS